MKDNCVYLHIRPGPDGPVPFYVGKGNPGRPHSRAHRSAAWRNVVAKHGYDVLVLDEGLTPDEASELERRHIAWFGRRDVGLGPLVNHTDGGEGLSNASAETRARMSESAKRRDRTCPKFRAALSAGAKASWQDTAIRAKMVAAQKAKPEFSAEHRANLSAWQKGKPKSAEHVAKLRGKKRSPEAKARMAEAQRKRHLREGNSRTKD